jgi:predicted dehydrogenase
VGNYSDWSPYKQEWLKNLPGGIVSEHLPHALYVVRWFLGAEPTVDHVHYHEGELYVSLKAGDKRAQISYVSPCDLPMVLDVTGSDGTFRINHSTMRIERPKGYEDSRSVEVRTAKANIDEFFKQTKNMLRLIQHYIRRELGLRPVKYYSKSDNYRQFTDIAKDGRASGEFRIDGREGLQNVRIFDNIWKRALSK